VSADQPFPSKRFGQHFLKDKRTIQRIIDALAPEPHETIVEIGPGAGALTSHLVDRAGSVVAVEFDNKLEPLLNEQFGSLPNFRLVMADALVVDFCNEIRPASKARLVANLPYNISTAILQRLIEQRACLGELVVMLQREVVERMIAPPGSSDRGYLSVLIETYCETEKLFDVAPGAFRPPPKVWSSVVRLQFKSQIFTNEELLWETVSRGFSQKRKTILNNLRSATGRLAEVLKKNGGASIVLCKAGVELQRRAETLTIEEWGRIVEAMQ
jgi:16S rRNA (adenine1518-N6/adenine1519-N6)-dimethyltransferase